MEENGNGVVDEGSNGSDVCEMIEPVPPIKVFTNNIAFKHGREQNISQITETQVAPESHDSNLESQSSVRLHEYKIKLNVSDKQFTSKTQNGDVTAEQERIALTNGTEIEEKSISTGTDKLPPKQAEAVTDAITNDTPKKDIGTGSIILEEANTFLDLAKRPTLPPIHSFLLSVGKGHVLEACLRDLVHEEKKEAKKFEAPSSTPDSEDDDQTDDIEPKDQVSKFSSALGKLKLRNEAFRSKSKSCTNCGFKTDSDIVLREHMEMEPHYNMRGLLICPVCDIAPMKERTLCRHMKEVHDCVPRFERTAAYPCKFCYYDADTQVHLSKHLIRCMKVFDLSANLAPPKGFTPALVIPSARRPPPPPQAQRSPAQPIVRGGQHPTARPGLVQNAPPRMMNGNHSRHPASPLQKRHPAILGKSQPGLATQYRGTVNRENEAATQPKPNPKRPLTACDICAEFMTDKTDFKKHLLSVHNIILHTFQYKGIDRDMLLCGICNAYFTTFVGVQHHMSKNHPGLFKKQAPAAAGPGGPKRTRPQASTSGGQSLNGGLPRRTAAPAPAAAGGHARQGMNLTTVHPCRYCGISFVNMNAHVAACQFRPVNNRI